MKTFNFFIFLILFSTVFVSCGEKKTSPENNSMQQDTVGSKELAHIDYVCPMDCEKGKVYHEMGKCPKCKMDLIKKEHEDHDGHDHHEGDGHDHKEGDGHDHKEGDGHDHKEGDGHDHKEGDGHEH